MNTSSRWLFGSLVVVALTIADAACSSSSPLKKISDAAVARDLGADEQLARDALPNLAGPDLAEPDLLVQVIPDASLAGNDTVLADLPAGRDTILVDLPAGRDAALADLRAGKDTVLADLPVTVGDAPASDVPAGDGLLPADSVTRDGPTDGAFDCRSSSTYPPCNDNMMSQMLMGTCQPDGTCACNSGFVINPSTGRCNYPKPDASTSREAGPATVCTGEYTACGCGCCGGVQATPRCYYPSLGETIAAITAQDQAAKSLTNCDLAGCSMSLRYLCCAPAAPSSSATYAADSYIGDLDHLQISKSGADCAAVDFARPMVSTYSWLRITTPSLWGVVGGEFGACGDAGAMDQAQGAVGTLAFRVSGALCVADLHATLFAFAPTGEVKSARFDVDGLEITGIPATMCQ